MRARWRSLISRNYRQPTLYFSKSYFFELKDVGKRISLHSGRKVIKFPIKKVMVGHFAGEFIFSKKLGASIHISKKRKLYISKILKSNIFKTY